MQHDTKMVHVSQVRVAVISAHLHVIQLLLPEQGNAAAKAKLVKKLL